MYKCCDCNYITKNNQSFRVHLKTYKHIKNIIRNNTFKAKFTKNQTVYEYYYKRRQIIDNQKFTCYICNFHTHCLNFYIKHLYTKRHNYNTKHII